MPGLSQTKSSRQRFYEVPLPIKPCKYCGLSNHYAFTCSKRPHKSAKPHPGLKQKKPLNKRGKHYRKWQETRLRWLENNKAPYYWCHYCHKQMTRSQLTLDHKQARSRNPELRYALKNLVPCCWDCNTRKGSLSHEQYEHICHT